VITYCRSCRARTAFPGGRRCIPCCEYLGGLFDDDRDYYCFLVDRAIEHDR
jgi:hypothetical protein